MLINNPSFTKNMLILVSIVRRFDNPQAYKHFVKSYHIILGDVGTLHTFFLYQSSSTIFPSFSLLVSSIVSFLRQGFLCNLLHSKLVPFFGSQSTDIRKRGRPEPDFSLNGGFKKSKQGLIFSILALLVFHYLNMLWFLLQKLFSFSILFCVCECKLKSFFI